VREERQERVDEGEEGGGVNRVEWKQWIRFESGGRAQAVGEVERRGAEIKGGGTHQGREMMLMEG